MNFAQTFMQATQTEAFALMENRDKLPIAQVYNKELTLVDCAMMEGQQGDYVIMLFAEYPNNFVCGGSVVTGKLKKTAEAFGSWEGMVNAIKGDCPRVVFTAQRSKRSNNNYTDMEVK